MSIMAEYIDREALLAAIRNDSAPLTLAMVFRHIYNATSADVVEVRHGEWLFDDGMDRYCSACGHYALTPCFEYKQICTPYCAYCGIKMDGGEDDS